MKIKADTLQFLRDIQQHNNKEWMDENRSYYKAARDNVKAFMQGLEQAMNQVDEIEFHRLSRINRDIRFSKDKTPYKDYFWGYLRRFGAVRRGSYTICIEPNGLSSAGGGFYGPNKDDLYRIRKELEMDRGSLRTIIDEANFVNTFNSLQGEGVKTAPRGFDKQDPNIDLIRRKQFYAHQAFTDKEVLAADFFDRVLANYQAIRPFFNYMSEVLTTDLNGESIL